MLNGQLAGASSAHATAVKSMGSHIEQLMADNDYLRKKLFEENPDIDAAVVAEIEARGDMEKEARLLKGSAWQEKKLRADAERRYELQTGRFS